MSLPPFSVTWDYRCPFARNAHEHLLDALADGADWQVTFVPFSLSQVHVPEDGVPVWEDEAAWPQLLALEAGVVVRDTWPEAFPRLHRALFAARHDEGADLREQKVVRDVLHDTGLDADRVMAEIASGRPREQLRREHETAAEEHGVWGVPTFLVGERAAFVRLMDRPEGNAERARTTIERVVRLVAEQPELNELKHTTLSR